jgi:hypothetical protein
MVTWIDPLWIDPQTVFSVLSACMLLPHTSLFVVVCRMVLCDRGDWYMRHAQLSQSKPRPSERVLQRVEVLLGRGPSRKFGLHVDIP